MNPAQWGMMGALVLCVALSAFFSASETAYSAASKAKLKTMQLDGNRRAGEALRMAESYDRLLTAILVGNNLVNITGTSIATVLFTGWVGELGATMSTVVMTLVILLLGEVSPKSLAKRSPETTAVCLAPLVKAAFTVLGAADAFFALWRRLLNRLFPQKKQPTQIEEELMTMVDEAQSEGDMDAHEGELVRSALELRESIVKDIMTPRVDVTAIEDNADCETAGSVFRETGYSRIPVFHEDLDHITGILYEKDFYARMAEGERRITHMMQEPVYASESLHVSKLLKLFQTSKTHIAVVLDEFGGTEGIVTMEDALEELVGEIYDEYDDVSEEMVRQPDGSWLVDGGMQLDELLERLSVSGNYEADTVGGWAGEMLGRIPSVGSEFDAGGLHAQVASMDRRRVTRMRIRQSEQTADAADGSGDRE